MRQIWRENWPWVLRTMNCQAHFTCRQFMRIMPLAKQQSLYLLSRQMESYYILAMIGAASYQLLAKRKKKTELLHCHPISQIIWWICSSVLISKKHGTSDIEGMVVPLPTFHTTRYAWFPTVFHPEALCTSTLICTFAAQRQSTTVDMVSFFNNQEKHRPSGAAGWALAIKAVRLGSIHGRLIINGTWGLSSLVFGVDGRVKGNKFLCSAAADSPPGQQRANTAKAAAWLEREHIRAYNTASTFRWTWRHNKELHQ